MKTEIETRKKNKERQKNKIDDTENLLRRNNLRLPVIDIPEKEDGMDSLGYVETLLSKVFGNDSFTQPCSTERAHSLMVKNTRQGRGPRPFLLNMHYFKDR